MARMNLLDIEGLDCGSLQGVNLELARGEVLSLSGPSGSGKTRLLRAIADLDPNQGKVELEGRSRESMPGHQWRRRVAYLASDSHWWAERVGEHFSATGQDLAALGFGEEVLEWEVARLSSGERARLALLRLWSREPQVLLLDEPTANLDADSTRAVEAWLSERCRSHCGILWISHDPEQIARMADRALRIEAGRLRPWK
jgi:ABC-type iron transport system FetAB ATPase subunit